MRDPLSTTFAALADPTRRALLAQLARGEATVNELAAPHELTLPAVSRHLAVLERAGLVAKTRQAQWRPCRLVADPLREVDAWVEEYRRFFTGRFDRLAEQLSKETP
ncbi:ArsR/SmtB family transcription factor [Kineococcus sp. SYSU DK002]|uniref:ArsR/SmtB family transcription factor n=1 Tax=Kineococcus sp. SYSU DK002 TaxID=3383123 RepID=UPI003D7DA4E0